MKPAVTRGPRRTGARDLAVFRTCITALRGQAMREAVTLKSVFGGAPTLAGALAGVIAAVAVPARATSDLKLTDAAERDIERRLFAAYDQKLR